eukprot:scaffold39913_cov54-Phaeocystis_antarctica.AAC.1
MAAAGSTWAPTAARPGHPARYPPAPLLPPAGRHGTDVPPLWSPACRTGRLGADGRRAVRRHARGAGGGVARR